jgi:hypothetical protein
MRGSGVVSLGAAVLMLPVLYSAHPTGESPVPSSPTFYRDVLPILQKNCQSCHRPGQIAPFSLLTYESARPWARSMKTKVEARQMPPWFADPKHGRFSNDPSLTPDEIGTIAKWADNGASAGDPADAPPAIQWAENGWTVTPDYIIKGMDYPVPAHTRNDVIEWATYIVPTGFAQDTWITSLEVKPSELAVTHHICISFIEHDPAVKYNDPVWVDRQRDEAGVDTANNGINNLIPPGTLRARNVTTASGNDGCYVPGKSFEDYRAFNAAKLVPAGSDVRVQIHYTPSGKDAVDRPEIGVTIAKEPPERIYVTSGISAPGDRAVFAIPPNDPNWSSPPAEATFEVDAELVWMMPHMHVRGKDMTYTLVYPDGRREIVLNVPRYDFNWQLGYILAKPVKVTKGTKLLVNAHFDNSPSNKFNPDPSRTVYMGTMTWEEMMFPFFSVVVDKGVDPRKVLRGRANAPDGAH